MVNGSCDSRFQKYMRLPLGSAARTRRANYAGIIKWKKPGLVELPPLTLFFIPGAADPFNRLVSPRDGDPRLGFEGGRLRKRRRKRVRQREGCHPLRDFQFLKEVYGHRNEENCPLYIKDVFRTVNRATSCGKLCDSPWRRIIRRVLPRLGWSRSSLLFDETTTPPFRQPRVSSTRRPGHAIPFHAGSPPNFPPFGRVSPRPRREGYEISERMKGPSVPRFLLLLASFFSEN